MLRYDLIHPPLLEALASCGHGSRVLLADGNFPAQTVVSPGARMVHLNLTPGMFTVAQVLRPLLTAVNVESAMTMALPDGEPSEAELDYAGILGQSVPFRRVSRFDFYDEVRSVDVGVAVATADERTYGNLLLTIGLR